MGLARWGHLFLSITLPWLAQVNTETGCPAPMLSRLESHVIANGENLETIAQKYQLVPETLIGVNPNLANGLPPVGTTILIPPLNGIIVEVPPGVTWRDLEAAYGVRADLLFEINGCQAIGSQVFIPGINWNTQDPSQIDNYTGLEGYPLPSQATIGLNYGWHNSLNQGQGLFHSGIDLLAPLGTPVLAAAPGIVVFTGEEGNYGNLVVINHEGGRQTRYAHLQSIEVIMGQEVNTGQQLGRVGMTGKPDLPEPHLHFEVRYQTSLGWMAQDPVLHLVNK